MCCVAVIPGEGRSLLLFRSQIVEFILALYRGCDVLFFCRSQLFRSQITAVRSRTSRLTLATVSVTVIVHKQELFKFKKLSKSKFKIDDDDLRAETDEDAATCACARRTS